MVMDRQVRRLMMECGSDTPLSAAAMRVGMSENTARRYRRAHSPVAPDPFAALWPEIEALLVQAPGLEAPQSWRPCGGDPRSEGQLRTLQRRIQMIDLG
jgi:hypothetical protein